MVKKPKKYKPYVPPPVPEVSEAEAKWLERNLRESVDSWADLQKDPKEKTQSKIPWRQRDTPGIDWKAGLARGKQKMVEVLLPESPKRSKKP